MSKRAIAPAPSNPRDDFSYEVAGAWAALSPFKKEVGIAVERWRLFYEKGMDPTLLYYAVATFAAQAKDDRHPSAPYHAVAFTEEVARMFCAKIGEVEREISKAERDNVIDLGTRRSVQGLHDLRSSIALITERRMREHSEGGDHGKHEG